MTSPHEHDLAAAEAEYVESRSLTAAEAEGDERAVEAALRPRTLDELIGQERVREQLGLVLQAARARGRTPDHVRRSGAFISCAMIIASVVLPSPGGPESSTWSGARPRPRAASRTSPSWSRTRC